jgi:uncharacterized membrane protein
LQYIIVYFIGALGYGGLELAYRGHTHWTMLLTGGICFAALYAIANFGGLSLLRQCILGTAVITAVELLTGIVVNIWLGWDVWDYSSCPFNLKGQICAQFSLLWFGLCVPVTYICRSLFRRFNIPNNTQADRTPKQA